MLQHCHRGPFRRCARACLQQPTSQPRRRTRRRYSVLSSAACNVPMGHTPCGGLSNDARCLVARQVACGSMHTLAIADGRVYGWGSNECVVLHCVATLCCNDVVLCGNMHHRHDFIHTGPMKY